MDLAEGFDQGALAKLTEAADLSHAIGTHPFSWQLESDIAHIHGQLGNHEEATAARSRATKIRDMLASWMPDEDMRSTYLEFTQRQIDVPLWKWPDASTPA